jgi:tight adherence protein B
MPAMAVLLFTFGVALALSFTILMLATQTAAPSKSMQERLITIRQPVRQDGPDTAGAELEKVERRPFAEHLGKLLQPSLLGKKLQVLLVHANSTMSIGSMVMASAGSALGCTFAMFLVAHQLLLVLAAMAAGLFAPYGWLTLKRGRRLNKFNAALPEAIDLMARALRAGHSMNSAIELIAEQSPQPLAGEFFQVFQQQKFGLRVREALLQMAARVPSKDLKFLVTAILVQKETGGDLTEILDRTAHVIRERIRIEGEVRVHTAQGRLTGWILGLLPVIMLALINLVSPGYSKVLFHDPTGQKLLYAGATLIAIGGLIIRKVVDVQV